MDERLKKLMQELGNAINESLSNSDRIAAAIGEIKLAGYDVLLVLEATIAFNKREDAGEEEVEGKPSARPAAVPERETNVKWTGQDKKFAHALKVRLD